MRSPLVFLAAILLLQGVGRSGAADALVPARDVGVLAEADVVVVGGGSGGVAAAVEAARRGAKVYVLAPRPYLGEDLCATYRLWLEEGEQPSTELGREIFAPEPQPLPASPGLSFTYKALQKSSPQHRDTSPESLLADGKWNSAANQSVQYDSNAVIVCDLGQEREITGIRAMVYQRPGDFEVERILVSTGDDGQTWTPLMTLTNTQLNLGAEERAMILGGKAKTQARRVRLEAQKTHESRRVLLGEIIIEGVGEPTNAVASSSGPAPVRPLQVKRTLEQALVKAGVPFLYGTHPIEVLRDGEGKLAGVVIASRSGTQAVLAKQLIDATEHATLARLAGAKFTSYPTETQWFSRTVVGGPERSGENISKKRSEKPITILDRKGTPYPVHEYQVQVALRDGSFAAMAQAEQLARDWTWTAQAVDASETLFQVPPDSMRGRRKHEGAWPGADQLSLETLQPAGVERLYVLGPRADVSRAAAEKLARPVNALALGARVGEAAAQQARQTGDLEGVRVKGNLPKAPIGGVVADAGASMDIRASARTVPGEARSLPVIGEYDVVVVGGGTGGAPAGIGAGRRGARTLVIEYLHGLGGVGTLGLISSYYHGNRVGFTSEVDAGIVEMGGAPPKSNANTWNPETKSEWYRQRLRKAGVDLWYGAMVTGALVEDHRVRGVVVATPHGPGVVRAKMVIDATGNADVAASAGATCRYTDATDLAVQGTGLPPRELGARYTNTDYTFVDDTDVFDLWRALVVGREKYNQAYDMGQLVDTRERRQIVGDLILSPMDMMLNRTFPDTVVIAKSNFDSHGYTVHPMFLIRPPDRESISVRVPWRCLLPKGLDGVIVTGLGVSAHRDAIPVIRMQPDVQNQGYAAGVAAAMLAQSGQSTRELDVKALQRHLVDVGILPEGVLKEQDSFPIEEAAVRQAVQGLTNGYQGLEMVLARWDLAQPLVRVALTQARGEKEQLTLAHVLGMMGDAAGAEVLIRAVDAARWDAGWRYTGMGQFGPSMSPLDSWIIALGRTRDGRALKPLLEKAAQLDPKQEFSHFRALAIALENLGDAVARPALVRLLQMPGVSGHAETTIQVALQNNPASGTDVTTRNRELTEIYLARALFRCGDQDGLGERILRQYAQGLHGHYARHARAVLGEKASVVKP